MLTKKLVVLTGTIAIVGLTSAGCATKGHVRSEIQDLRSEMENEHGQLRAELDSMNGSLDDATLASSRALEAAEGAHALALGHVGFNEVERHRVYFGFDNSSLDEAGRATLDQIASSLEEHPHYRIDLYGFADPSGSESYNYALGARRADSVRRYLTNTLPGQLGRYQTVSFGEVVPDSEVATIGTRAQMRQVIVSVVEPAPLDENGEMASSKPDNDTGDTGARSIRSEN